MANTNIPGALIASGTDKRTFQLEWNFPHVTLISDFYFRVYITPNLNTLPIGPLLETTDLMADVLNQFFPKNCFVSVSSVDSFEIESDLSSTLFINSSR